MATKQEIEALKENWKRDPCWDIYATEGFEDHIDELKMYQFRMEMEWSSNEILRITKKAAELGCSTQVAYHIEELEAQVARLLEAVPQAGQVKK